KVDDPSLIGLPETPRTLKVIFNYKIDGQPVSITKDLVNKYNSPERGEVYRPLEVVPAFSVRFLDKVYVFADESGKEVHVELKSFAENQTGTLRLDLPTGWRSNPSIVDFTLGE